MLTVTNKHIEALNSFFDYIYVLTIDSAKDRQDKIKSELVGLNYSFFYGVNKSDLDMDKLERDNVYSSSKAKERNRYNKGMKLGEIACSLGHSNIYEDVIKNRYKRVLILEDDVVLNLNGIEKFTSLISELPNNWDLIYFDYTKHENRNILSYFKVATYHIQKVIIGLKLSHLMIKNLFPRNYSEHLKKSGYHYFTSAYAITENAANVLKELQTPIQFPSDHLLAYAATNELINGFISTNKLFNQQSQGELKNTQSTVS